jgi:hypothetical protein
MVCSDMHLELEGYPVEQGAGKAGRSNNITGGH